MFAASKTSASASAPPAATTGVFGARIAGAAVTYGQSARMPDGRMAMALTTTSTTIGYQMVNTDNTMANPARYSAIGSNTLYGLTVDSAGYIYLGGNNTVYKCDTSGNILWSLTGFSGQVNIGILAWNAGTLAFTASPRGTAGAFNTYLYSVNSSTGAINWARNLTNGQRTELEKCDIDNAGNIYIGGLLGSYNAAYIKFDSSGTVLFQNRYGFDGTCTMVDRVNQYVLQASYLPNRVRIFNSSNTCVAGQDVSGSSSFTLIIGYVHPDGSYVTGGKDPANNGLTLMKFDLTGALLWKKNYKFTAYLGNSFVWSPSYISLDSNNNYFVTGFTNVNIGTVGFWAAINPTTGVANAASATLTESNTVGFTFSSSTVATPSVSAATSSVWSTFPTLNGASTLASSANGNIYIQS